ncbi:MAG TPA: RecQ family ATP-dependent DNA helicase [Iamia sp.]|nr:RecQ family ATP-dependent DNA helicase [Iamia sp.]
MTTPAVADRAQELLARLAGPDAVLRPEQAAAIAAVTADGGRALVVQRTGFGKSAIYFIATRLRRDAGAGPTLVVSPLLALMRDQVAAAERLGVRSATINSTNLDDWDAIEEQIAAGGLDLLCISPERLNNPGFVRRVLPSLSAGLGLLVVDEAHCISDWGHDFRPDYRRIRDAIASLSPGTPVLATTATANERVCADVAEQLGADVVTMRGTLDRESLHLGVARLPSMAHRLAWIAQRVATVEGTGIVYCLTVAQTALVADFLRAEGIDAHAYSSDTHPDDRLRLEDDFKANRLKVLVATSALGMGVDKPDVAFVLHLGAPPSPIAYYQQVGRAGRAVPYAEAWLLPGEEDQAIWSWFAGVGLPPEDLCRRVLDAFEATGGVPLGLADLEREVDMRRGRLETLLKILDVDGAVEREGRGWVRTARPWSYDRERVERVRRARDDEAEAMLRYARGETCLMRFLRTALDDPLVEADGDCGRCAVCTGTGDPVVLDPAVVRRATELLRGLDVPIEPRKQWARSLAEPKGNIKADRRAEEGRALARVDDAGWWPVVERAFLAGDVDDELVEGVARCLKRWPWERPTWVTWVPSSRPGREALLDALAHRIGQLGRLPVANAVIRRRPGPPQAEQHNAAHKLTNVWGAFVLERSELPGPEVLAGPVLVVDDLWDSGWTMTVVADLLRAGGTGPVLPFALARR